MTNVVPVEERPPMTVVCLEGCHGSGKTELTRHFSAAGFMVLDEAFLDMPSFSLHPQSFVMESIWVSHWIERLLRMQEQAKRDGKQIIYFADRSPYSAVFYAKTGGHLLEPLIKQQLDDLRTQANIHIVTVYIRVDGDILWERIQSRLRREPMRKKFNEDSRQWMDKTVAFYRDNSHLWDFTVDNNQHDLELAFTKSSLIDSLAKKLVPFQAPEFSSPFVLHHQHASASTATKVEA